MKEPHMHMTSPCTGYENDTIPHKKKESYCNKTSIS